ncbi:hypothetical protein [Cohnella soli]|uniref:LPXTG cell wall anchor domain-containing protein n=1 Tax=Cohnella soli TaxID=425005 RepID=A0ABW0HZG9_9BACL
MVNRVLNWVLLLCVVSFALNGLLYWTMGKKDVLINLYGAVGLGILTGIGILVTRKKR